MCAICNFKIDFGVSHPQSLSVAVATRRAIDEGRLPAQETGGPLVNARLKLAAVDTLNAFQARVEAAISVSELLTLPDFYILLIETDTWGFFHATSDGFDPDVVPDLPNITSANRDSRSVVLITSEVALRTLNTEGSGLHGALEESLFEIDASPRHARLLRRVLEAASERNESCA